MMEYSYVAVAGYVPEPYQERIVRASQEIAAATEAWYVLDRKAFPAHLSLWLAYIPTENIESVAAELGDVTGDLFPVGVRIHGARVDDSGYISLRVGSNDRLAEIHQELLNRLNGLREGYLAPKYADNIEDYLEEEKRSLLAYGTRFAGRLFSPHMTVAVVGAENVGAAKRIIERDDWGCKFVIDEILYFRQKEAGKSIEVLNRFPLAQ